MEPQRKTKWQLPTWLAWLNLPLPRPVVLVALAVGVSTIVVTKLVLSGLEPSSIVFAIYCGIGGIGLAIEYSKPECERATRESAGCCEPARRNNRLLEAWFFVSGNFAIFALALMLFAILDR
jgi:hypothetical protein